MYNITDMNPYTSKKKIIIITIIIIIIVSISARLSLSFREKKNKTFSFISPVDTKQDKCFFLEYILNKEMVQKEIHLSFDKENILGTQKTISKTSQLQETDTFEGERKSLDMYVRRLYMVNAFSKVEKEHYRINHEGNLVKYEYSLKEDIVTRELVPKNNEVIGTTIYYSKKC